MSWTHEVLVRERQREMLADADRRRLAAEARRTSSGSHLSRRLQRLTAQVLAAARLRSRLA